MMASGPVSSSPAFNGPPIPRQDQGITAEEIALYDRQIRLWGVKAQEKIKNANILIISMNSLAAEIAKNLVLAGINSLTIIDHKDATAKDLGANFFLTRDDLGKNRAAAAADRIKKLNPRVTVVTDRANLSQTRTAPVVEQFDLVIATSQDTNTLTLINTATRATNKPFYAASVYGMYGYIFSDLIEHEFVVERERNKTTKLGAESRTRSIIEVTEKEDGKPIELVKKVEKYSTWFLASDAAKLPEEYTNSRRKLRKVTPILSCLRALWEFQVLNPLGPTSMNDLKVFAGLAHKHHKSLGLPEETLNAEVQGLFFQNIHSEITPVSAILGGQLAQDVINVLGGREQPIQNFVIFDGDSMEASVFALHPPGPLGNDLFPNTAEAVRRISQPQDQPVVSQHDPSQPGVSYLPDVIKFDKDY
ncbi:hypothetical protein BJ878DRAFT_229899 [Calycina marina]|uniref:Ubiquitin-like 1-activating enzyme E1A n=1 Tax=Calycina marina TaxID=1763456 RepID=A0A9P8CH90_9HELO|nr:hypothetical protein BJ878DRAFT_229899 [Calycina marina]